MNPSWYLQEEQHYWFLNIRSLVFAVWGEPPNKSKSHLKQLKPFLLFLYSQSKLHRVSFKMAGSQEKSSEEAGLEPMTSRSWSGLPPSLTTTSALKESSQLERCRSEDMGWGPRKMTCFYWQNKMWKTFEMFCLWVNIELKMFPIKMLKRSTEFYHWKKS